MEIGGYLELDNLINNEYYANLISLNTGRNALACLIREKQIKKICIPTFLCDSIYKVCEREKCSYSFYEIDRQFRPVFNRVLDDNEWLYIVNYYGQITNEQELKSKYKRIIFDNVHAFYQKPVDGIDTIYSCRKFFGVPDGAYLASDINVELPADKSRDRMLHILGRFETTGADYYTDYAENEETYYNIEPKLMSRLTHNILGALDYKKIRCVRERNYEYLHSRLAIINPLNITVPIGPYMYPLYMEKPEGIRRAMIEKKIYIPILWPEAVKYDGIAKEYAQNILPLPVDQRYSIENMKFIISMLSDVIGIEL